MVDYNEDGLRNKFLIYTVCSGVVIACAVFIDTNKIGIVIVNILPNTFKFTFLLIIQGGSFCH